MLFDTHAHMDDRAFDGDRAALLEALPGSGIGLLVNPGCSLASSEAACALAKEYGYIYAAVGSHPDAADEVDEAALDRYRQLVRENSKVVAIGEGGAGDGLPLYVPGAFPGPAERPPAALPHGRGPGGTLGDHPGGGPGHHL